MNAQAKKERKIRNALKAASWAEERRGHTSPLIQQIMQAMSDSGLSDAIRAENEARHKLALNFERALRRLQP